MKKAESSFNQNGGHLTKPASSSGEDFGSSILFDFEWLLLKLKAVGVSPLLAEFDAVSDFREARILHDAIRLPPTGQFGYGTWKLENAYMPLGRTRI